jgi:hypothetical protein
MNLVVQTVDRFNKMSVSALVAPSNSTILVLHNEGKPSDDYVKHFLFDVSDLYMKVCRPASVQHEPVQHAPLQQRARMYSSLMSTSRSSALHHVTSWSLLLSCAAWCSI